MKPQYNTWFIMPTHVYHIESDNGIITNTTAVKNFLNEWEFSVEPTITTDETHNLHTGSPFISFTSRYGPSLMIEHKHDSTKHNHEFYNELADYLTSSLCITETQIHPETDENTIIISPETGVIYK